MKHPKTCFSRAQSFQKLDGFVPGLNLPFQGLDYGRRQQVDKGLETIRVAERPLLDGGVFGVSPPRPSTM